MKNLKIIFLLVFTLLYSLTSRTIVAFANTQYTLPISAQGAIIMNAITGEILYGKNINTKYAPASTTKIMTALLVLENCKNLDEKVKITKDAENIDGSKIFIYKDEEITVKDLLYSLLLASANDCAYALSLHIGGTYDNFIKMMNDKAKKLGCENTNFTNPHGLYDINHRSSAKDLALIMREVVKHDEYLEISSTPSYAMSATNKYNQCRPLWNGNKAIHQYDQMYNQYTKASKTGYTVDSLHSYVTYVEKDNEKFVIVLTHDKEKNFYKDSKAMAEFAFKNFSTKKVIAKNQIIKSIQLNKKNINLIAGDDVYITIDKNIDDEPIIEPLDISTSNLQCQKLFKNEYVKSTFVKYNEASFEVKTVSDSNYEPTSILNKTSKTSIFSFIWILIKFAIKFIGILISLIFFLLLIRFCIRKIRKKYKKNKSFRYR